MITVPFIKGQSGNYAGRPGRKHIVLPAELLAIDELTPFEVQLMISKAGRMDDAELDATLADARVCVAMKAFSRVWKLAAEKGDVNRLEFLLNRTIGKPVELAPQKEGDQEPMTEEEAALATQILRSRQIRLAEKHGS